MRSDTAGKLVNFSGKPAKIPSKLLLYRRQANRQMTPRRKRYCPVVEFEVTPFFRTRN